jgi:hypothetical protein
MMESGFDPEIINHICKRLREDADDGEEKRQRIRLGTVRG